MFKKVLISIACIAVASLLFIPGTVAKVDKTVQRFSRPLCPDCYGHNVKVHTTTTPDGRVMDHAYLCSDCGSMWDKPKEDELSFWNF